MSAQVPPFLRLPLELREDIIEQAFDFVPATQHPRLTLSNPITRLDSDSVNSRVSYRSLEIPQNLNLFRANKQLHTECRTILTRLISPQSDLLGAIACHDLYGEWLLRRLPRSITRCIMELQLPTLGFDEDGYWVSNITVVPKRISFMVQTIITYLPILRHLQLNVRYTLENCLDHRCGTRWCWKVYDEAVRRHFGGMLDDPMLRRLSCTDADIEAVEKLEKNDTGEHDGHEGTSRLEWSLSWDGTKWTVGGKTAPTGRDQEILV